jgi:DNA-binding Xre family transcriptional regulator
VWWDSVQTAKDEPYLLQLMLAEGGPDAVQCSATEAVEIKKWAAAIPGWKDKTAPKYAPHPLAFRDLPRYRVEKVMTKRGWGTAKEMAEASEGLLSPEQAREAMRNLNARKMTLDTVIRLCKTLGVSIDDIFGSNPRWY